MWVYVGHRTGDIRHRYKPGENGMWYVMTEYDGVKEHFDLFDTQALAESVAEGIRDEYESIGADVWVEEAGATGGEREYHLLEVIEGEHHWLAGFTDLEPASRALEALTKDGRTACLSSSHLRTGWWGINPATGAMTGPHACEEAVHSTPDMVAVRGRLVVF